MSILDNYYTEETAINYIQKNAPNQIKYWRDFFCYAGLDIRYGELYCMRFINNYETGIDRLRRNIIKSNTKPNLDTIENFTAQLEMN